MGGALRHYLAGRHPAACAGGAAGRALGAGGEAACPALGSPVRLRQSGAAPGVHVRRSDPNGWPAGAGAAWPPGKSGQVLQALGSGQGSGFLDVGSGVGKLVVQAWLEVPGLARSAGIELSRTRHAKAVEAWAAARLDAAQIRAAGGGGPGVRFVQGDVLISGADELARATELYVAGLCFPMEVLDRLALTLANQTHCPQLRSVASLVELKPLAAAVGWQQQSGTVEVQVSWGRAAMWVYRNTRNSTMNSFASTKEL